MKCGLLYISVSFLGQTPSMSDWAAAGLLATCFCVAFLCTLSLLPVPLLSLFWLRFPKHLPFARHCSK